MAIAIGDGRMFPSYADPYGRDVSEYIEIVVTQFSINFDAEDINEIYS